MTRCADWFTLADLDCDAYSPGASGCATEAMDWVYAATGARWPGQCQSVIRPVFLGCNHRDTWCQCRPRWTRLDLTYFVAHGPIVSIDGVTVGGVAVDDTEWRLDSGRWLSATRNGPGGDAALIPWPTQDMSLPITEPGTWSITVTHGANPPSPLVAAARDLACQLIRRRAGHDCDLPDNATSISQDGVSVSLNLPTGGLTGIPRIDTVLQLYGAIPARRMMDPAGPEAATQRL